MLTNLFNLSIKAGHKILEIYNDEYKIHFKDDNSPLTEADKASHIIIQNGLEKLSKLPILSEEGEDISFTDREKWEAFWLVDPLDGTKEFIKRNGEFTVNISLIEGKHPTEGFIYAPVLDLLYFTFKENAYMCENASSVYAMKPTEEEIIKKSKLLRETFNNSNVTRIVASRSHMSDDTQKFVNNIDGDVEVISTGSSLKFCLVAEGKANYYPRFAPTMEWDTAAGQAIIEKSGGSVIDYKTNKRLEYNNQNLLNNWFIVKDKKV